MSSDHQPIITDDQRPAETILLDLLGSDIMIDVRRTGVSCLESPYVLQNIHFSGPCALSCPECHSKQLWTVEPTDQVNLHMLVREILRLRDARIIEGVGLMGADSPSKRKSAPLLTYIARLFGLVSVVYTGYDIDEAKTRLGNPDFFVCGPYVSGDWDTNKKFYMLTGADQKVLHYTEITKTKYFDRQI